MIIDNQIPTKHNYLMYNNYPFSKITQREVPPHNTLYIQ